MDAATKDMEQQQVEALLGSGIQIPPQPQVLIELEKTINHPRASTASIAKLVTQDAALTAAVFKVINSPAYGLRRKIDSLDQAISVIGMKQMANIIKSVALRQAMGGKDPFYELFWERSGEIAQLAAIIATKQRSVCNLVPDQVYMAGLFHDCGIPVLMQRFPDYCKTLREAKTCDWSGIGAEDQRLHTDHCVAGYMVARHWQLPDFICQAVRFHHDILHTEHQATTLVAILQLGMHIYNVYRNQDDREWAAVQSKVLSELGLSAEGLKEFEEDVYDSFQSA
jgi:HD-like signal output (HDOD) protein